MSRLASHILSQCRHYIKANPFWNLILLVEVLWNLNFFFFQLLLEQLLSTISTSRRYSTGFFACFRSTSYLLNSWNSHPTFRHEILYKGQASPSFSLYSKFQLQDSLRKENSRRNCYSDWKIGTTFCNSQMCTHGHRYCTWVEEVKEKSIWNAFV